AQDHLMTGLAELNLVKRFVQKYRLMDDLRKRVEKLEDPYTREGGSDTVRKIDATERSNMEQSKTTRIVVIGTGFVGSSYAYALVNQGLCNELVLIDINLKKAEGDAMDLGHAVPFGAPMRIWAGDYADCRDADLV